MYQMILITCLSESKHSNHVPKCVKEGEIDMFYLAQFLGRKVQKLINFVKNPSRWIEMDKALFGDLLTSGIKNATFRSEMPRLSTEQRWSAIGMLESGMLPGEIALHFGCSTRTIVKLRRRHATTGTVDDHPRSGRPRVTTGNQDRYIRLHHLRDRWIPASRTAAETIGTHGRPVSSRTIRRRLNSQGLRARRPFMGPILTIRNRQNRSLWAQQHLRWTHARWDRVLFTDESRFCVSVADGRKRVWRRKGERYSSACVLQHNRFGGGSVMVWAGISGRHRTDLVIVDGTLTARRYIDQILEPHVLPFFESHPTVDILMQDNARPHAARITKDFLEESEISVMNWIPYSPDLNPLEHLWDELGRRVQLRAPTSRAALIRILLEEWAAIPQDVIRNLVRSMRSRCQACIDARGGHTRY